MSATNEDTEEETEVVSTRLPVSQKRNMQHEAVDRGISLSELVNELLNEAWGEYQAEHSDDE